MPTCGGAEPLYRLLPPGTMVGERAAGYWQAAAEAAEYTFCYSGND